MLGYWDFFATSEKEFQTVALPQVVSSEHLVRPMKSPAKQVADYIIATCSVTGNKPCLAPFEFWGRDTRDLGYSPVANKAGLGVTSVAEYMARIPST